MNNNEKIELYSEIYNSCNEMFFTLNNNDLLDGLNTLQVFLNDLNKKVMDSKEFNKEQKEKFIELTDHISNRIYFNC